MLQCSVITSGKCCTLQEWIKLLRSSFWYMDVLVSANVLFWFGEILQCVFVGNGKTHFIRKKLKNEFPHSNLILTLNESFDPLHVINQLHKLSVLKGPIAVYLNFTFVMPLVSSFLVSLFTISNMFPLFIYRHLKALMSMNSIRSSQTKYAGSSLNCSSLVMLRTSSLVLHSDCPVIQTGVCMWRYVWPTLIHWQLCV